MAIAASYEARRYGIQRGTPVWQARQLCPGVIVAPARHDRYVEMHHQLLEEVERYLPIHKVYSVDEWVCALAPSEQNCEAALAIGRKIQQGILRNVGSTFRSSIGLAPSVLLAKLVAESKKPDGLSYVTAGELPEKLRGTKLQKIPGIGKGILQRLSSVGVREFMDLWRVAPKEARKIWGSVQGERFWYSLHGHDIPDTEIGEKNMIGHSRVLLSEQQELEISKLVARTLLLKAASRLRHYNLHSGGLGFVAKLHPSVARGRRSWGANVRFEYTQDSYLILQNFDRLWRDLLAEAEREKILPQAKKGPVFSNISVSLHHLASPSSLALRQTDMFTTQERDVHQQARHRLWAAIDRINADMDQRISRLGAPTSAP